MALVTLKQPIQWPGNIMAHTGNGLSVTGTGTLDGAGEYSAVVLCARETMTISHVAVTILSPSGSPTADIRIETVDASTGLPSGTLWATDTNIVTGTLTAGTNVHELTEPASIAAGQIFCVKIAYNSGTSFQVLSISRRGPAAGNLPYVVINTGSPAKSVLINQHCLGLGSSSTTFYAVPGLLNVASIGGGSFNNTNGARRGLRFTAQFNCRCVGICGFFTNGVGDYNAILMSDAGSELSSSSTAFEGDASGAGQNAMSWIYFDNPVTLTAGTTYRAVIEPSSATNVNFQTLVLAGADFRSASPCGTFAHYTSYASAAWDDSATATIPYLDILIDQIDDGAGSGGGTRQKVYGG
jgi:hypothetical protein